MTKSSHAKDELADLLDTQIAETTKLRSAVDKLTGALEHFTELINTASDDDVSAKMDTLIKHNEDIARGILLMLEVSREHLPQISKHTRMSAEGRGPASQAREPGTLPQPRIWQTQNKPMPPPLPPRPGHDEFKEFEK